MIQWHIKARIITTNLKFKIDFILPDIVARKNVTGNFHVDDSNKRRYDMILGRDILIYL